MSEPLPKSWELWELEPNKAGERRWGVGVNGPRAYLTCDEPTAKLIEAAPELLAACKMAIAELGPSGDGDNCWDALRLLQEAVDKAEGKP